MHAKPSPKLIDFTVMALVAAALGLGVITFMDHPSSTEIGSGLLILSSMIWLIGIVLWLDAFGTNKEIEADALLRVAAALEIERRGSASWLASR
jgi:hypothetical protein